MTPARRRTSALTVALAACLGLAAGGVRAGDAPKEAAARSPHPAISLDDLFARLKAAGDPAEAKGVAGLIERRLARSGSATADLLSDRARQAMTAGDLPLAVELMDRAVALEPGWAEGWSRMATLFFRLSDQAGAVAELERALVLEPRHFEAWAALGKLYLAADDKRRALDAFRRAADLYPHWEVAKDAIAKLAPEIDGRDL